MTIKKTVKLTPAPASETTTIPTGGATIADRFKLDAAPVAAPKASNGKIIIFSLVAGVLAAVVAGMLAFTLWKHWEFLQGA